MKLLHSVWPHLGDLASLEGSEAETLGLAFLILGKEVRLAGIIRGLKEKRLLVETIHPSNGLCSPKRATNSSSVILVPKFLMKTLVKVISWAGRSFLDLKGPTKTSQSLMRTPLSCSIALLASLSASKWTKPNPRELPSSSYIENELWLQMMNRSYHCDLARENVSELVKDLMKSLVSNILVKVLDEDVSSTWPRYST